MQSTEEDKLKKNITTINQNKIHGREKMIGKIIKLIALAIIFFGLGYLVENRLKKDSDDVKKIAYQEGWEAARNKLQESGLIAGNGDAELKSLAGLVQKIEGDKLILKIQSVNPLDDPELNTRTIEIDGNTKIYKQSEKDQGQYGREMEEFNKKMNDPDNLGEMIMPDLYTKEESFFSEIKIGNNLIIISNENIKNSRNIKAVEVVIQDDMTAIGQSDDLLEGKSVMEDEISAPIESDVIAPIAPPNPQLVEDELANPSDGAEDSTTNVPHLPLIIE